MPIEESKIIEGLMKTNSNVKSELNKVLDENRSLKSKLSNVDSTLDKIKLLFKKGLNESQIREVFKSNINKNLNERFVSKSNVGVAILEGKTP